MGEKKSYQEWCVDTLLNIYRNLSNYDFELKDKGYRYAVNAILTNHASMYYWDRSIPDKKYINLWWDHLNKDTVSLFFKPLLMSADAAKYLDQNVCLDGCGKLDIEAIKTNLHLEHITPNGVTIDAIEQAQKEGKLDKTKLKSLLKYHKLVLITKEQCRKYLDGAKGSADNNTVFNACDVSRLKRWAEDISPMANCGDSCKSKGNGPLRLAHLVNCGVTFIFRGDPIDAASFSGFEHYFGEPFKIVNAGQK